MHRKERDLSNLYRQFNESRQGPPGILQFDLSVHSVWCRASQLDVGTRAVVVVVAAAVDVVVAVHVVGLPPLPPRRLRRGGGEGRLTGGYH